MAELISEVKKGFGLYDLIKSIFQAFRYATLELVTIDQHWIGGVLVYNYKFRIKKHRFSRSVSKNPMPLDIPHDLHIAEFRLDMPQLQTRSVNIPASKINISAHDLIGNFLDNVHNGQEIPIRLRIPCSFHDISEIEESRKTNLKVYKIRNPNNFHMKSCDIRCRLLEDEAISEIQIVKGGTVVCDRNLVKIRKTIRCDFECDKLIDYFPSGISTSNNGWFNHKRTENIAELTFTLDLNPYEEIEIRLYFRGL